MTMLQKSIQKSIDLIENKSKILRSSSGKSDADLSKALKNISDSMGNKLESNEYADAILTMFQEILRSEIYGYTDAIADNRAGERVDMSSAYINKMNSAVVLYGGIAKEILEVLSYQAGTDEYQPVYDKVIEVIDEFRRELSHVETEVGVLTRNNSLAILTNVLGDNMVGSAEEILEKIDADISKINVALGKMVSSPDQAMQAIYKMVTFQHMNTERATREAANELYDLQAIMNDAGYKDMSMFHETYDGNNTGNIISALNWGEFQIERQKMRDDIIKLMNDDTIKEFSDIRFNDLTDKQQDDYNARKTQFFNKYMEDDRETPKPPVNQEFVRLMNIPEVKAYYDKFREIMRESREILPKRYRSSVEMAVMMPQMRKDLLESVKSGKGAVSSMIKRLKER